MTSSISLSVRRSFLSAGFLVAVVIVLSLAVAGCGSSSNSVAASVNGHDISLSEYAMAFRIERSALSEKDNFDACANRSLKSICKQWKQITLNSLIDRELIREYAAKHGISVSKAEDEAYWRHQYQARFGSQPVLKLWLKVHHETLAFLRAGLHADLLQQKVLYPVTKDMPPYAPAVHLAVISVQTASQLTRAQRLLKQGVKFLGVAIDLKGAKGGCQQGECGDLGWVPYSFLPFGTNDAKQVRVGKLIGPIRLQQAFELYKVEGRKLHYQLTTDEQYQRRQQLFRAWLKRQEHGAQVKRFVAV